MLTHPEMPALCCHDDEELALALGQPVISRRTIHAWLLSWVQQVTLADGRVYAYKCQLPPSVERSFYEAAHGVSLLPTHVDLGNIGGNSALAVEWVEDPLLRDCVPNEKKLVEHGHSLSFLLGELPRDMPISLDIGSIQNWDVAVNWVCDRWTVLIERGLLVGTTLEDVFYLREWAASAEVHRVVDGDPVIVHGDLRDDQVFVGGSGGYRVIDWQRPLLGPSGLDFVGLLISGNVDPLAYCSPALVGIHWFLLLRWAVLGQHDISPNRSNRMLERWAMASIYEIKRSSTNRSRP